MRLLADSVDWHKRLLLVLRHRGRSSRSTRQRKDQSDSEQESGGEAEIKGVAGEGYSRLLIP